MNWFEFSFFSLSYSLIDNMHKIKKKDMGRGKVSALDKRFQKLQKNEVIIHKIAKEIFNEN